MGKINETLEKIKDCGYVKFDIADINDMIVEGEEQVDVEDVIIAVTDHNRKYLMDYADARFEEIEAKKEEADTEFFKAMAEFGISGELAKAVADAVSKKAKEEVAKRRKEKNTEDTTLMDWIKELFD